MNCELVRRGSRGRATVICWARSGIKLLFLALNSLSCLRSLPWPFVGRRQRRMEKAVPKSTKTSRPPAQRFPALRPNAHSTAEIGEHFFRQLPSIDVKLFHPSNLHLPRFRGSQSEPALPLSFTLRRRTLSSTVNSILGDPRYLSQHAAEPARPDPSSTTHLPRAPWTSSLERLSVHIFN
jgi:hypothetical protein